MFVQVHEISCTEFCILIPIIGTPHIGVPNTKMGGPRRGTRDSNHKTIMSSVDFSPSTDEAANFKCFLVAAYCKTNLNVVSDLASPRKPAIRLADPKKPSSAGVVFTTSAILSHFLYKSPVEFNPEVFDLLDYDELVLSPVLTASTSSPSG